MQIIMPKLGLTMTHGTVTEWLKAPGDPVAAEEALCVYETEKVTLELPAPEAGVLTEILVAAGETVAAGTPLCVMEEAVVSRQSSVVSSRGSGVKRQTSEGDGKVVATPKARALARQSGVDLGQVRGSGPAGRIQAADVRRGAAAAPIPAGATAEGAPLRATPLARRIAAAEGVDLRTISGTGPDGTITREDVEAGVGRQESGVRGQESEVSDQGSVASRRRQATRNTHYALRTTPAPDTVIPISNLRRVIGERMSQSASAAPHVTLFTEAEATNLVSARVQLNEELTLTAPGVEGSPGAATAKISYNTLFVALVARALREHPRLNSRLEADGIHELAAINIALAVDTERGLVTPVLREADRLALPAIQAGYDALIGRALAGKSLPDDFEGGTFTITNLGSLEVDGFTPIINPPQAAILGIGRIVEKPAARGGAVVVRPMVTLSLSFDHRIVDGAPAGRFLQRIKQLVERPMALVLGGGARGEWCEWRDLNGVGQF
jgi:pyruvate dehydrogenase E2 component (dihydrolipoamide acetyltransferase)